MKWKPNLAQETSPISFVYLNSLFITARVFFWGGEMKLLALLDLRLRFRPGIQNVGAIFSLAWGSYWKYLGSSHDQNNPDLSGAYVTCIYSLSMQINTCKNRMACKTSAHDACLY